MEAGREPGRIEHVRRYVADVVACRPDDVTAVSRFEDGNRHDVYRASYRDAAGAETDLVVRVSLADDPADRSGAERESMVLQRLAGVGAPELVDLRLESPWFETPVLSMRFVPGRARELASSTPADIERLGSVVASVHTRPVDDLADRFAETGTIRSYAEARLQHILHGLPWARPPLPLPLRDGFRLAADVIRRRWDVRRDAESFRTDEHLALLHGDIAFGNVLWGPDPVLIDWEYARLGDPADEIAYLFDQNGLDATQREAFWRGYRGARAEGDVALAATIDRVGWWEPLTLLGSALWWVERFVRRVDAQDTRAADPAVPKDADYYLERALTRWERLAVLLELDPA